MVKILGKALTRDYLPTAHIGRWTQFLHAPRFHLGWIETMCLDPRIGFGLWLIKGPLLSKSRFYIDTDNDQVRELLKKNVTRFWRNSAARALKAIEWGYSCSEVMYRIGGDGDLMFNTLRDVHPLDCRAVTTDGELTGCTVRNVPTAKGKGKIMIPMPKSFWHVHERQYHPWYGRSRLKGAFMPWIEKWLDGGYRESRKLFFHKYAYQGPTIYHPPGVTQIMGPSGETVDIINNKDLARELVEKGKTGSALTLPNTGYETGAYAWKVDWPVGNPPPTHVMEYGKDLNDELLEGLGIPVEVVAAEGTGAYAGRQVPQDAFYAILQEIVQWLISDADEQIFRFLVQHNLGNAEYEIVPFNLLTPSENETAMEQGGGSQNPYGKGFQMAYNPVVVRDPPEGYVLQYGKAA